MFWRLFGAYGALVLLSVGTLGVIIAARTERNQLEHIQGRLEEKAKWIEAILHDVPRPQEAALWQRLIARVENAPTRLTLIAEDGRVLADSARDAETLENHMDRPEVQVARREGLGTATRFSTTVNQPLRYVALRTSSTGSVAYVRVSLPLGAVHEEVAALRRLVWSAAGLTALLALAVGFWLARRITRPLQELTRSAERIAAGEYGHNVYAESRDEIGQLAQSFNRMSARLAGQFTQLDEDRQQLRTVLGSMIEGVVALDAEQRVLFANERALVLLECAADAAVGRRWWEVVRHRPLLEVVDTVLAGQGGPVTSLEWDGPQGKGLTVYASALPDRPPRGAVLVFHDVSELRRLERLRQEFVANVSHELKTPLAVIQASVETLIDGAVDDAAMRGSFLERIAEQAERLHRLILDLLMLARIEAETEVFEMHAVSLADAVRGTVDRHRTRASGKQQELLAVPPAADGALAAWADEEVVREILDNLVDNALKYTPSGGAIRLRWGTASPSQVFLEVQDTGIGIAEQDLQRIFERFYRVDKARSRELGGTGLGLSIVKHLVQAMHGTVHAASQPGQGSTFTVHLPAAPGA